jgi:hypothetical protein
MGTLDQTIRIAKGPCCIVIRKVEENIFLRAMMNAHELKLTERYGINSLTAAKLLPAAVAVKIRAFHMLFFRLWLDLYVGILI